MTRMLVLLRIGFACCFIGHGAFGLLQKREWLVFFQTFGIGADLGSTLMPIVGTIDIAIGIAGLLLPMRALFLYAAIWCLFTAALRPLAGLSFGEVIERAGNFGVPLALLVATTGQRWFARVQAPRTEDAIEAVIDACRWVTAWLLAGHGWLAMLGTPLIVSHLDLVGLGSSVRAFGALELGLAAACVLWRSPSLMFAAAGWKIATEALFPLAGAPIWEFVERGGSYTAPLVAALLLKSLRAPAIGRPEAPAATRLASAIVFAIATVTVVEAQAPAPTPATTPPALTADLLAQLQRGGFVVACRHAITSHEREDRSPVDFDDPGTQRVLSAAGEAQATQLGKDLVELRIPFSELLASPYDRARRSVMLMFGKADVDAALSMNNRGRAADLKRLMTSPVASGGNRLLMTHQGLLYQSFGTVRRGSVGEGDCLIVKPAGDDSTVLALVKPPDWTQVRVGESAPAFSATDDRGATRSLAELRGGYVVLEWHEKGCPYVAKHYKSGRMQALQKKWNARGVRWLLLNSSGEGAHSYLTPEESQTYFKSLDVAATAVLLDPKGLVGRQYGVTTALHMVIVDPAGKVVYNGAIDDQPKTEPASLDGATNYVDRALTELFAGRPVSTPASTPYGCEVHYSRNSPSPVVTKVTRRNPSSPEVTRRNLSSPVVTRRHPSELSKR
ncbi:MAG TPA: redoxin domain-containing protein [Vicinamibacterales bacterium]|nr:redoxin domain-containing protein [Vicinamibacterales bacterium]